MKKACNHAAHEAGDGRRARSISVYGEIYRYIIISQSTCMYWPSMKNLVMKSVAIE